MRSEVTRYYEVPCVAGAITGPDDIPGRARFEVACPYCGGTHTHSTTIDPGDTFAGWHHPPCGNTDGYAVRLRKERRL